MDSVPKLIPTWHDVTFQDFIKQKAYSKFRLTQVSDHGGIGLDINCDADILKCEISKHAESQIKFGANCCALPFIPLQKIDNLVDPCLESLRKEKSETDKFCYHLSQVRKNYKRKLCHSELGALRHKIQNILDDPEKQNEEESIKVSKILVDLADRIPKRALVPTSNYSYAGGNLAVCKSVDKQYLLYPRSEDLKKLCITPLQDEIDQHFRPDLSGQITVDLKDELILQIESSLNEFCCVRQKSSYHLLNVNNMKNYSKSIRKSLLHHISASPYNPLDILSVYEKGVIKLRNMETRKYIWSFSDNAYDDISWLHLKWSCGFGSQPFSALSLNERALYSFDFRAEGMKEVFNIEFPSFYADEELVTLKQWNRNPFQHFLASNYHLIICDERYLKKPVMFWNHTLNDYPMYCDIANLENNINCAVIGTQGSQKLAAFFLDSSQTQVHPVSSSLPLTLSSPTDCIDSLKLHCYNVNEKFSSRFSFPLTGVCVVPHSKETAFTTFQLTSVGDIFYQDFKQTLSDVVERTYHVSTGCVLTPLEKILPHLKDSISNCNIEKEIECADASLSRLKINVGKFLNIPKEISANCTLCRMDNSSDKKLVFSEICPSCGLDSVESQHFSINWKNSSALIGPTSDESNFLDWNLDYSQFSDQYSKRMLSVWMDSYNPDESSQNLLDTETNLEPIILEPNLEISTQVSADSTCLWENMPSISESQAVIEMPYDDSVYEPGYSQEVVPSSQEVRTLIGETLFTPVREKVRLTQRRTPSTAGF